MGASKYRLSKSKKNGFASFPRTLVEAIFWDKKKKPLEEVLDGKIDQPLDPAYVGKVPQVAQDGTVDWVVPLAGATADSAMSDSSTNAPQNKVVKQYVDTVDGKVTALGHKVDGLALGKFYGFFPAAADLPAGDEPGYAYVGASAPFAIYVFEDGAWSDSGSIYSYPVGNGEDIDINEAGELQFANRTSGDGNGYVILRKDKTFAEQVTKANTIYEIRYDFDLGGASVTIPSGCVLKFVGGKLSNGGLVCDKTAFQNIASGHIDDIVVTGDFTTDEDLFIENFVSADDSKTLTSAFSFLFGSKGSANLVFDGATYEYYAPAVNTEYYAPLTFSGCAYKKVSGNGSTIKDLRPASEQTTRLNFFIKLVDANYIEFDGLDYEGINELDLDTELGYQGSSFIHFDGACSHIRVNANIVDARHGVSYGQWGIASASSNPNKGLADSDFIITALRVGYPFRTEKADHISVQMNCADMHRAAYLDGVSNSVIDVICKDNHIAPYFVLLSLSCNYENGAVQFYGCNNLAIRVKDSGTTTTFDNLIYCVGIGFDISSVSGFVFENRATLVSFDNIEIKTDTTLSNGVASFGFSRYHSASYDALASIPDIVRDIDVDALDNSASNKTIVRCDINEIITVRDIRVRAYSPTRWIFLDNASTNPIVLHHSLLNRIAASGIVLAEDSTFTKVEQASNMGNTLTFLMRNSQFTGAAKTDRPASYSMNRIPSCDNANKLDGISGMQHIIYNSTYNLPSLWNGSAWKDISGNFTMGRIKGGVSQMPHPTIYDDRGYQFFNTTNNEIVWWNGYRWIRADGTMAYRWDSANSTYIYVPCRGAYADRPTSALQVTTDGDNDGFTYYCTDTKKMILWNGTAWVNMDGTALS